MDDDEGVLLFISYVVQDEPWGWLPPLDGDGY
jgi:hypothetical protein